MANGETDKPEALLVEDDDLLARAITRRLSRNGFDVTRARSYMDALEQLVRDVPFDFVTLDFDLGTGKSGLDVAKMIVELPVSMRPNLVEVHSGNDDGAAEILHLLASAGVQCRRWVLG